MLQYIQMVNTLSRDEILKLAKLSRLILSDKEVDEMQKELSSIIDFVSKLSEAKVDNLEVSDQVTGLESVLREDNPTDYGYGITDLMSNVPYSEGDYIKVPKMLSES